MTGSAEMTQLKRSHKVNNKHLKKVRNFTRKKWIQMNKIK